jgi:hypothetical protein
MVVVCVVVPCILVVWSNANVHLSPKDGGGMFLWNVGIYLQVYTQLLLRQPTSTPSLPWKPQISAGKEVHLEVDTEEAVYMFLPHHQTTGQIPNISIPNKTLKSTAGYRYLAVTVTNQNCASFEVFTISCGLMGWDIYIWEEHIVSMYTQHMGMACSSKMLVTTIKTTSQPISPQLKSRIVFTKKLRTIN